MVELVHAGRSPEKLAEEFEPTAQSIRNWVAQAPITMRAGVPTALTTTEREELERLRRENRQLKLSGREARMVVFEFIEGLLQSHAAGHSSIGLYGILSGQLEPPILPDRLRAPPPGQSRRTPACRRARGRQGQALRAAPSRAVLDRRCARRPHPRAGRDGRMAPPGDRTKEWTSTGGQHDVRSHILIPSPQLPTKPGQVQNRLGAARVSN